MLGQQFDPYVAPNRAEYTFEHGPFPFQVRALRNERPVGIISWSTVGETANRIEKVYVQKQHRRKGVASAMLDRAREINPAIHHSTALTPEGRAWSEAKR